MGGYLPSSILHKGETSDFGDFSLLILVPIKRRHTRPNFPYTQTHLQFVLGNAGSRQTSTAADPTKSVPFALPHFRITLGLWREKNRGKP